MKLVMSIHLKVRLKERVIPKTYPKLILANPEEEYVDTITNHKIAVKRLKYNEKLRPMVVVYDIIDSSFQVVTIYPTTEKEIKNRRNSNRWTNK